MQAIQLIIFFSRQIAGVGFHVRTMSRTDSYASANEIFESITIESAPESAPLPFPAIDSSLQSSNSINNQNGPK